MYKLVELWYIENVMGVWITIWKDGAILTLTLNLHVVIDTTLVLTFSLMITTYFAKKFRKWCKKRTKDKTAKCRKTTKDKKINYCNNWFSFYRAILRPLPIKTFICRKVKLFQSHFFDKNIMPHEHMFVNYFLLVLAEKFVP